MKRSFILASLVTFGFQASVRAQTQAVPELVIYTYDSFVAKGGPGPEIFPLFEKICGCKVRALPSGDGGQLLNRLQLDSERGKPGAQVVLGLDQHLWDRAKPYTEGLGKWTPAPKSKVIPDAQVGAGFVPFDYGVFALMADQQALRAAKIEVPHKLSDLLKPEYKRNLILEDPRTSTPGLSFLLLTQTVLGDGAWAFWTRLKSQWLTLAPGWDGAYGLFLKQEAPLVWSYTTSQAYHSEHGDHSGRYQAALFDEGQPVQIEGAAIVKGTAAQPSAMARAKQFLEFLQSDDVQKRIAVRNWMLPVVEGIALPDSFKSLPQAKRLYRIQTSAQDVAASLKHWSQAIEAAQPGP